MESVWPFIVGRLWQISSKLWDGPLQQSLDAYLRHMEFRQSDSVPEETLRLPA